MAYIKRAAENTIAGISKMFPVLLVTGPRQVGKQLYCKSWQKQRMKRVKNVST